jgi:molybdate transport system substrate-binding protein
MTRRFLLTVAALGLAAFTRSAVAGAPAGSPGPLVVLAGSSLTESLQAVAARWSAGGHPAVTFSFDASSRLAKQVEAGVPADLFFSADSDWMDYLGERGLIDDRTRVNLLGNALVAVVPTRSTLAVTSAAELGKPEVARVALAGENVPVGKYGRAALTSLGAWGAVKDRVVNGDNVRTVLGWVATGEADAGVVYVTDARVESRVRIAFTFPATSYPTIVYPAAVLAGSARPTDAADFLAYCKSAEGMAVFTAAGFTAAPAAPK